MALIEHPFEGLSRVFVPGNGPKPCRIMLVGESPGHEEDQADIPRPFIGKTGQELDRLYLPMAMLRRREVFVSNLVKCHPFANRNPTKEEIEFFEPFLQEELAQVQPEIIVPMGFFATRYFLGNVDLHTVHGLLHRSKKFPDRVILPSYHPAAGLHNTETQALIAYDFEQIKLAMMGGLPERPEDQYPDPVYLELKSAREVHDAVQGTAHLLMGADTEGYKNNPWGLSFSIDGGIAYVIRAGNREAISAFAAEIKARPNLVVILHNALHDLPIFRDMGIEIKNFEDTMVYSFVLCIEPQGLKDLAYRRCGMKMKSYDEVVGPAVRKMTSEYLVQVASTDWGLDPPVPERDADEEIKYRQPQALHKRALKAVNDIYGMWTGTVIGERRGGSAKLDDIGVRVGKVDHDAVVRHGLRQEITIVGKKTTRVKAVQDFNAWHVEVPVPIMPKLEEHYGEFIWELTPPVPPADEDQPDPVKRWETMSDELEESVERCEAVIGALPETGLDALEDQDVAIRYSARDAHSTLLVRHSLRESVEAAGLLKLAQLDMSVLPYIDRMKTAGLKVNKKHMLDYGAQLLIEMRQLQEKLKRDLGIWINPSSSKQVAMVIYDLLGFPVEVRTEHGAPSTNDKVLEGLAPLHTSIKDITDFRELHKLRSTYAIKLPNWMDVTGRLHTTWKATRVPSGRLASANPNLMAIPIRSERGNMIRRGFVPADNCVFVGVDLSQIEMRVLAHLSRDPNLMSIFLDGKDFHAATAAFMWKLTEAEIAEDHKKLGGASKRSSGKNVSFGIVYGIGAQGLKAQLKAKTGVDWTEEECQAMIDLWLESAYQHVKYYMERQKYFCRRNGYVQTLFGRRRYLPGVNSSIPRIRAESERQAINHPVQGSASEVVKLAMRNLWNVALPTVWEAGIYCEPVLQVHDELIFEVQADAAYEMAAIVVDQMQLAMDLCVPVLADFHVTEAGNRGGSWADLK